MLGAERRLMIMSDKEKSPDDTISFETPQDDPLQSSSTWIRTDVSGHFPPQEHPSTKNKNKRPLWRLVIAVVVLLVAVSAIGKLLAPEPDQITTQAPVTTSEPADDTSQSTSINAIEDFDWESLVGEKLSNAYSIMDYNGIDHESMSINIVTDDGKHVVANANWTVESVERKGDAILFHVRHDVTEDGRTPLALPDNTDGIQHSVESGLSHAKKFADTATDTIEDYANGQ